VEIRRLLLLLLLALQPTVGFSLLSDFLPLCSFFTLLSPPSYSHYLQIFFNHKAPGTDQIMAELRKKEEIIFDEESTILLN
jgi:hypothetical protein